MVQKCNTVFQTERSFRGKFLLGTFFRTEIVYIQIFRVLIIEFHLALHAALSESVYYACVLLPKWQQFETFPRKSTFILSTKIEFKL